MDIDTAIGWDLQNAYRQNLSVSRHNYDLRRQVFDLLYIFLFPKLYRLKHRDPQFQSFYLYRRRLEFPGSPFRFIRLRIDRHDLVTVPVDLLQRLHRKLRCAHENRPHYITPLQRLSAPSV